VIVFIYGILTAVILPIPVEFALIIRPETLSPYLIAVVIGLAKMVGAGLVFILGLRVEGPIRYTSARYRILGRIVGYITRFVRVTKWMGLLLLLSIPLLPDTLPIYLYSLFNKQGQLIRAWVFLLVNFVGGTVRALIWFALLEVFGIVIL
jgi:membrane protein DedA with SNARE-associated domain